MGIRPSQGQGWKRYAVLGDPRPTEGQVWPRYSGVYVPPSGGMFYYYTSGAEWPIGTSAPAGVSFGPDNPAIYQWATHLAPGSPDGDDWLQLNVPMPDTLEVVHQQAVLRDETGAQLGTYNDAADLFHFQIDPEWPFATPGHMPNYFYYGFEADIWSAFGVNEVAGQPVYCDVDVLINGQPFTIRYFDPGYEEWGPYTVGAQFDSASDVETSQDWIHVVPSVDFVATSFHYYISEDDGATWKHVTRCIIQDAGDPSLPLDPTAPVMQDYDPADIAQGSDILLGLYNISGDYVTGITDISGIMLKLVWGLPGYDPTNENGPYTTVIGPLPPPTSTSAGPFNVDMYVTYNPQ